jgi:hypothetical protein
LKKAVPVALVLIAGAAVILWFGNRLNSWVLGGLIGGLASLLLSIPISLTLFAYFARQHAQHEQYTQVRRKRLPSRRSTDYLPDERDAGYYADENVLVDGEISTIVEEYAQPPVVSRNSGWLDEAYGSPMSPARQLPSTASSRRATRNGSGRHLPTTYGARQQKTHPVTQQGINRGDGSSGRKTTRRMGYSGRPGSQQDPFRSRFRSDALRTARLEAVRQNVDEDEDYEVRQEIAPYREAPIVRRATRYLRDHNNEDEAR